MDLNAIKESIVTKVYHLTQETNVPLHKHDGKDEIFYCIKGSGFGILAFPDRYKNFSAYLYIACSII